MAPIQFELLAEHVHIAHLRTINPDPMRPKATDEKKQSCMGEKNANN